MNNPKIDELPIESPKQDLKAYTSPQLKVHGSLTDLTQCCDVGPDDGDGGFPISQPVSS